MRRKLLKVFLLSFATILFLLIPPRVIFAQTLTVDPAPPQEVSPGQFVKAVLEGSFSGANKFALTIKNALGTTEWYTITFYPQLNSSCFAPRDFNGSVWSAGKDKGQSWDEGVVGFASTSCKYYININTASFDCNPEPGNTNPDCGLYLTKDSQQIGQPVIFKVKEGTAVPPVTISFEPGSPYSEKREYKITATGCPSDGNILFRWYVDNGGCFNDLGCDGRAEVGEDYSNSGSNSIEGVTFDTDGKEREFYMKAYCSDNKTESAPFKFLVKPVGFGHEYIDVPIDITPNKNFDIVIGGLENKVRVNLTTEYSICYYLQIKSLSTGKSYTGGSLGCSDENTKHMINKEFYAGSEDWDPVTTLTIQGGLLFGDYLFILNRIFLFDPQPGTQAYARKVCVATCRNDDTEFPPGKAPCVIGVDKANKMIDTRDVPDKELKGERGERDQIVKCTAVPTAFGVVGVDPKAIVETLLGIVLSFVGGIALLLILYAGYKLVTSRGNPEQVESARETLTSAIIGLLFIIFSVVILEVIGVDILAIPGFETDSQDTNYNELERQRTQITIAPKAPRNGDANPSPPPPAVEPEPPRSDPNFTITHIDSINGNAVYTHGMDPPHGPLRKGITYRIYFTAPDRTHLFSWGIKFRTDNQYDKPCTPTVPQNGCMVEYTVPSDIAVPSTVIIDVLDDTTPPGIIASTPPIPVE
ncbi:MAG: hypothetical protein HY428_01225 [Candidatus Levybacteria bacterium]|nr:hypothetical protein [Candidatus Levybacteria bacterium]